MEHVIILELTVNMRLQNSNLNSSNREELSKFSDWILSIGDGIVPRLNEQLTTTTHGFRYPMTF
jgi:hypothetical protein